MHEERLQQTEFHGDVSLGFDVITFIVLSSVLASVALISNSVPVLVGAMILAPIFDPLIAIPFGIINKDLRLAAVGLRNTLALFTISFAVCMITVSALLETDAIPVELTLIGTDMVTERLTVGWYSLIVAIAAGAGGALASASDKRENLVGVVVALALVPALAASAIGFKQPDISGWGGLQLFMINVLGIIIAGALVLYFRKGVGGAERRVRE